jgi:putative exosortase-associated protein (TIGR04073 family)
MRNKLYFLGTMAAAILLAAGCAGPEKKLGRGLGNMTEIVRGGEMDRGVEQGGLFNGPDVGMTTGFVSGVNHTLARTGVGIYEVVTAPFPPYEPIFTNYLSPKPGYPDGYRPRKWADPLFDTDHSIGFSGGDVFPWLPNSRFTIFDN